MKASFVTAAGLMLVVSPVLAQPHHRVRRAPAEDGSVVTQGSSIRITSTGEVIGPPNTIISVSKDLPDRNQGKAAPNPKPPTPVK